MTSHNSHIMSTGIRATLISITAIATLTGCSDENILTPTPDSGDIKEIKFEVSEASANRWNSRSIEHANPGCERQLPSLTLNGDGSARLYLHPVETDNTSTVTSRASTINSDNISNFGVFAAYNANNQDLDELSPDYMYNVEITRQNSWSPVKEYLWPGSGSLHFTAYSPYAATISESEGITRLPVITDKDTLSLDYITPGSVNQQIDLMIATPVDGTASPCNIEFNHALTAITIATGNQMTPCKILNVAINHVKNAGTLNLEDGSWSSLTGDANFTIAPDLTLTAASGSQYVAPGTPIADGDNTFLLIPQSLGDSATIALTIDYNGTTSHFDASLAGTSWSAGKKVVYNLSVNPETDHLELEIDGDFTTTYTGDSVRFNVTSQYISSSGATPINWKAEFIDDDGNVIDQPEWITQFPTTSNDNNEYIEVTKMQNFTFDVISPQSQILQNASDINTSSGNTPYNLSSATGSENIENTANTYIINAPGIYSIPLVYGNGIKDGSVNASAYSTTSHNRSALKTFVNHLENAITDPYIYNNTDCTPADATLVWEDHLNLVQDIKLSDDKKSIIVNIPHSSIRQGNAVVAVRDAAGNIMWSWQLWVTDYNPTGDLRAIHGGDLTFYYMARDIGRIIGDDVTNFPEMKAKVRFTQTDVPEGTDPLTKTIDLIQTGTVITTGDSFTLYQWGRKDPIVGHVSHWYDAKHREITQLPTSPITDSTSGTGTLAKFIQTPQTLWTADHTHKFTYTNLWNTSLSTTTNTKSIYDPSPQGFKVPYGSELLNFANDTTLTTQYIANPSGNNKPGFYITQNTGEVLYFPAYGYRSGSSSIENGYGSVGEWWISIGQTVEARVFVLSKSDDGVAHKSFITNPRTHAMGVFPMKE